jgi:hypothetical protein
VVTEALVGWALLLVAALSGGLAVHVAHRRRARAIRRRLRRFVL